MKKTLLTLFAMCVSVNIANAQTTGGFEGPSANQPNAITVKEALNLNDEAKVVLKGNISEKFDSDEIMLILISSSHLINIFPIFILLIISSVQSLSHV